MDATVLTIVRLALNVLSERLLTILALVMSFALACWTMVDPMLERLGMSAFFAMFSYLLVRLKERKYETAQTPE
jgi:small-conductance mechanosensitive channel